nr:response regulator [Jeotgalibacillus malaysiensis]
MIRVFVVEDDPMVASLNQMYINQVPGFECAGTASNVVEARMLIEQKEAELVLLDVYMPGESGLELLKEIRGAEKKLDVILITAASENDQIQQALRFGAIDYLIKPFEFDRLKGALIRYQQHFAVFNQKQQVNQQEIDLLFSQSNQPDQQIQIPKGLTRNTLELVIDIIKSKGEKAFATDEIAGEADISRVSIRKYLKFLTAVHYLEETLIYGVGRPVYQYQIKNKNMSAADFDL